MLNKEARCLIVKYVRFWFPFIPLPPLRNSESVFVSECGGRPSRMWAWWWSSCQQIRSLSLRLRRLMLKPLNKSIGHTHADARGFSATIVERYQMLHKRAPPVLEEGGRRARWDPGWGLWTSLYCFVPAFQVVPSQRHWNWGRAALVDAGCPWQLPGPAQQEQPRGLYPLC